MRWITAMLLLGLLALTGCNAAPARLGSAILEPPPDEIVTETALRHTIREFDRSDRGVFVAYVLPRSDFSPRLVENLRDVAPLVTDSMSISMEGGVAREREIGLPVKLWMVRLVEMTPREAPRTAKAEVGWSLGIGEARLFTLSLELQDGQWLVTGEKSEGPQDAPVPGAPAAPARIALSP